MKLLFTTFLMAVFSLLLTLSVQAQSCADSSYEFADIQAIFQANNCTNCHGGQGGLNLSDYNNVVTGGNLGVGGCGSYPDALSFLIGKIDGSLTAADNCGNPMPNGSTNFGTPGMNAADLAAIQQWIDDGAPEFCPPACATVDLDIQFDGFPTQTSWNITDAGGNVVASGGTYSSTLGNTSLTENTCLLDGCYTLNFMDSVNNGMCPFQSSASSIGTFITPGTFIASGSIVATLGSVVTPGLCGNYTLYDAAGTALASGGGGFGASQSNTFCLSGGLMQFVLPNESEVYLKATNSPQMRIIPNIVKNETTLHYSLVTQNDIHIKIIDITGKIVQQYTRDFNDFTTFNLNVSDLQSGFYFVQLISGDAMMVEKFVKR